MILKTEKVIKEYTDYNNHLNVAYYVRIFDIAADVMLDNFKIGGESAKKEKKYLAATNEVISLYVDLNERKVVKFDPDRIEIMDNFIKSNSSKFKSDKLVFAGKLKK